jgi:ATP-dependent helicase/DNAse subunit B
VKCYQQCPARYRYRYVKRMKEMFRSVEIYLGNTVHEVLEWLYGLREGGETPTVQQTLEAYTKVWNNSWTGDVAIVRVADSVDAYFELGRTMVAQYVTTTLAKDKSSTVALEQRLSRKLSDEIFFTGVADRIGRTEKGGLFIVDYKTSKNVGDASEMSEGLQAPLYAAIAIERYGEDSVLTGYHYLRHGVTRWQSVDRARADQVVSRFVELANETRAATEFPTRPGILCAWCGFNAICPDADVPEGLSGGQRQCAELTIE